MELLKFYRNRYLLVLVDHVVTVTKLSRFVAARMQSIIGSGDNRLTHFNSLLIILTVICHVVRIIYFLGKDTGA